MEVEGTLLCFTCFRDQLAFATRSFTSAVALHHPFTLPSHNFYFATPTLSFALKRTPGYAVERLLRLRSPVP